MKITYTGSDWYTPLPNNDAHDFELIYSHVSDGMRPSKLKSMMVMLGMNPIRFEKALKRLTEEKVIIKQQQRFYRGV
jgi:hypothetical protein